MCGRYQLSLLIPEIEERFDAEFDHPENWAPAVKAFPDQFPNVPPPKIGNVKFYEWTKKIPPLVNCNPGQNIPVVIPGPKRKKQITLMKWGFEIFISEDKDDKKQTIADRFVNTKIEDMDKKRTWKGPFEKGQFCILPVRRYFEPSLTPEAQKLFPKGSWTFRKGKELFGIAGIWEERTLLMKPNEGVTAHCFSMLTTAPNKFVTDHHIHHRMPVIIPQDLEPDFWKNISKPKILQELLREPYPKSDIDAEQA